MIRPFFTLLLLIDTQPKKVNEKKTKEKTKKKEEQKKQHTNIKFLN